MTLFDICVVIVVGFCLIFGGFRGLIREVSGIIGVVAGFYGANTYYPLLIPHIEPWITSPGIRRLVCFFILFCLILIGVGLIAQLIRKLLKLVFLGWVDRTFGVVFGAAKGILIVTVLFIMATSFIPDSKSFFSGSKTAPYLAQVADALTVFVSRNMKQDFNRHLEGLKKRVETIVPLLEIIRRLRGENGCEWDQKQTPLTMWKCLAEELYELEEAIVNDDMDNIIEELGDVLFQVVFILEIFTEKKRFDFSQVVDRVAEKMIRRHPHVYDTAEIESEDALNRQWERIKAEEKNAAGKAPALSVLDGVPKGMPGLLRALKVSKSAVKAGFEWEDIHQVLDTAKSEIREFEVALEKGDKDEAMMEFGDILFSLVNVARFAGFHPELALYRSTAKFEGRFRIMEAALRKERLDLKKMRPEEKDVHWQAAKLGYADEYSLG